MPSPDKSQSKSDSTPDAEQTATLKSGERSFGDTFAELPDQNQLEPTIVQSSDFQNFNIAPQHQTNLIGATDKVDHSLAITPASGSVSELPQDVTLLEMTIENEDLESEILEYLELDLIEPVGISETTEEPALGIVYAADMDAGPRNLRDISPENTRRHPVSELTITPQSVANINSQAGKEEISFENLPRYVKTVGDSTLPPQENTGQIQSWGLLSEDGNMQATHTLTQTSLFAPSSSAPLQSTPLIQGQLNSQIVTVPMRDVVQNVVQATLKQERTLIRIDPPELGRIQLDFDHSGSGKTIVTLIAETDTVKLMLMERRAFMVGLFEGYGLDDVEIQLGNDFDSEAESKNGQFFSNREERSNLEDITQTLSASGALEEEPSFSGINNTLSASQSATSRLHIRV